MAAEGLEKFTEVPVEFFKDGSAFVKKCQKPTKKGTYLWIFVKLNKNVKLDDTVQPNYLNNRDDISPTLNLGTVCVRLVVAFRGDLYKVNTPPCSVETFLWLAVTLSLASFILQAPFTGMYFSFTY